MEINKNKQIKELYSYIISGILICSVYILLQGLLFTFIWNLGIGDAFGLKHISSWVGVGIIFIYKVLTLSIPKK